MPTYKELMKDGVTGDNGMLQAFPPNTGVGWYTMATGAYPAEYGSRTTRTSGSGDLSERTSFSAATRCRRTRSPMRPSAPARRSPRSTGSAACGEDPRADGRLHELLLEPRRPRRAADPVEQAGSSFFGVTTRSPRRSRAGWTNVPLGDPAATPKETTWTTPSTFAAQNPNRTYNVYFYDSVTGGGVLTTTPSSARSASRARSCRSTSRSATSCP